MNDFEVEREDEPIEARNYSFEELDIKPLDSVREPNSDFYIGGVNTGEAIRNLETLNGERIEVLEERMRPGRYAESGFLDSEESLVERLIADNELVGSFGLTHQDLAKPLKYACALALKEPGGFLKFNYPDGGTYLMEVKQSRGASRGSQESPFHDGAGATRDITITNVDSKRRITFSVLLADMIERYGFYEGNVSYRLDPLDLIETFFPAFEGEVKQEHVKETRRIINEKLARAAGVPEEIETIAQKIRDIGVASMRLPNRDELKLYNDYNGPSAKPLYYIMTFRKPAVWTNINSESGEILNGPTEIVIETVLNLTGGTEELTCNLLEDGGEVEIRSVNSDTSADVLIFNAHNVEVG